MTGPVFVDTSDPAKQQRAEGWISCLRKAARGA